MTDDGINRRVGKSHGPSDKHIAAVKFLIVIAVLVGGFCQTASAIGPFELSDPGDDAREEESHWRRDPASG